MTQKEFGKLIGVTQGTVQKYEKGECLPSEEVQEKIAAHGGVTVDWLLHKHPHDEAPEVITIESPQSGPMLHEPYIFGGIDIQAMSQILDLVEDLLSHRKKPLKSMRKSLLISLLYDEFQKSGQIPEDATLMEFLRRVD